mmetsp:Transcript_112501/g.325043  ORF Transcript_112501/g.325043 Transcript_112501/m.325043 type:complete len:153 (-) Transcript_112501:164-622(-)
MIGLCCCGHEGGAAAEQVDVISRRSVFGENIAADKDSAAGGPPSKGGAAYDLGQPPETRGAPQPGRFLVEVEKTSAESRLGMDISGNKRTAVLRVNRVRSDGLIAAWNLSHPDQAVCVGDLIVEINGETRSVDAMHGAVGDLGKVRLLVERR